MTELRLSAPAGSERAAARRSGRPSFGLLGLRAVALGYLIAFILVPLIVVQVQGLRFGLAEFWSSITRPEAISAVTLSVYTSAVMALINTVIGVLTAFVLVRYRFPGKGILNTLIDLPFAIPTLVTGVMLVLLYGPQTAIGSFINNQLGIRVLFAVPGIILALLVVGYPFVIRTVQPVLLQLDASQTEAAFTIGAGAWTTFRRVIFPAIRPAVITGAMLSFARSLGEFGSVIVVAGNIPFRSQTGTVYVYTQVEAGDLQAASSVSMVLLIIAFIVTLSVDWLMRRSTHA